jgi:hypothetical protein
MSKLLDEAIARLRQLPNDMQDAVARTLIFRLDNEMETDDWERSDREQNSD